MHRPAFALSVVVAAALAGFALAKCSADRAPDPSLAPVDEAVDEGVDPGPAVEGEEGEERGPAGAAQEGRREIADVSLRGDFNPLEPAFKSQSKHREVVVFRVRSVTRGAPVANARVYILGFEDLYADSYAVPHVASAKRVAHVIERLVEAGASARSDSRGDVRLPVGDAAALVFCEHGQESVLRALTPKDLNRLPEARTLSLLPRRELRVALRDTKGTAVQGLPVSIAFPEKIQPIWLRQGSTDARGRVAIERASETLMLRQRGSWDGRVLAALVRADIPGLKRQKRVELATRTTQCSLVVPPTGSMLVRHRVKPNSEHVWTTCLLRTGGDNASPQTAARFGVANADGLREARFAHVALRQSFDLGIGGRHRIVVGPTRAGQEVVVDLTERPLGALRLELQDASGQAMHGGEYGWSLESLDKSLRIRPKIGGGRGVLFEELPIGQQFRVTIQRGGAERTVVVAGPSKVGEVKSARVTWASGPGIQLRVFGPDAKVMRGALISYSLSTSRGTQEGSHWRTDADGVFRLDFKGQTAKREIHFFEIRHEAKDGRVLFARREIGRKADQGRIDLGDVRLAEAAALLTGRVLVDGKAPRGLRKPFVSVEVRDASTADGRWVQGAGVEVSVERGGAFRVTGDPSIAQLRLRASYDQCLLGDWKELSRGASDVELSLASAAQFRAGFLVDDAELLSHLVVELVSDDANADARPDRQFGRYRGQARRSRGSKGGSTKQHLHWAGIPVGRYSLRVLALGTASAPLGAARRHPRHPAAPAPFDDRCSQQGHRSARALARSRAQGRRRRREADHMHALRRVCKR